MEIAPNLLGWRWGSGHGLLGKFMDFYTVTTSICYVTMLPVAAIHPYVVVMFIFVYKLNTKCHFLLHNQIITLIAKSWRAYMGLVQIAAATITRQHCFVQPLSVLGHSHLFSSLNWNTFLKLNWKLQSDCIYCVHGAPVSSRATRNQRGDFTRNYIFELECYSSVGKYFLGIWFTRVYLVVWIEKIGLTLISWYIVSGWRHFTLRASTMCWNYW